MNKIPKYFFLARLLYRRDCWVNEPYIYTILLRFGYRKAYIKHTYDFSDEFS